MAKKQLAQCLENAKKSVSSSIRKIRNDRQKNEYAVIPFFDLFVTFYKHITVNYTQLALAPENPNFVARTINIILCQWQRVSQYLQATQPPVTKLNFTQHCLGILYEMRKGGRILKNNQIIPDCEYTRTYIPSIEVIEQFGYKKNYITIGFKMVLCAQR